MTTSTRIGLDEIEAAHRRIAAIVRQTPVNLSPSLGQAAGVPVLLKLEHLQVTGSFKLRGASNAVARLTADQKKAGIVGVSTGNHGRGLAYAAREAGIRCIICMSELVPKVKVDGIRAQGAEVHIVGRSQDEAQHEVDELVAKGMTMIPPFDHADVIAGQGTLGLELLAQLPDIETIVVPLSGGGLIAGVAAAAKAKNPGVKVIGVSMERGAAMIASLEAGKPVEVEELPTLADSLGGGIGMDNRYTFAMARELVDETLRVSETEIAEAIRHAYWQERQIIEGSGAVGIAALLAGKLQPTGPTALILSGGNIDMNQHHRIIGGENIDVTEGAA